MEAGWSRERDEKRERRWNPVEVPCRTREPERDKGRAGRFRRRALLGDELPSAFAEESLAAGMRFGVDLAKLLNTDENGREGSAFSLGYRNGLACNEARAPFMAGFSI